MNFATIGPGYNPFPFATKELVFKNDTAPLSLFAVTGDVIVRIKAVCKNDVASAAAANIELGVSADTDAMIGATVATAIDEGEIWHDATPDSSIEAESTSRDYIISGGDDVILTLSGQVDSGAITFYCHWFPLSADGSVVAT